MSEILEIIMIVSFGASWPLNLYKSVKSRTAKGKSLFFEVFLLVGYAFGIARKIIQATVFESSGFIFFLSFVFYVLNFIAISIDGALYFRNSRLDKERDATALNDK